MWCSDNSLGSIALAYRGLFGDGLSPNRVPRTLASSNLWALVSVCPVPRLYHRLQWGRAEVIFFICLEEGSNSLQRPAKSNPAAANPNLHRPILSTMHTTNTAPDGHPIQNSCQRLA